MEPPTIPFHLSKQQAKVIPLQTLPTSRTTCEHIHLRQTILSPILPPLYISNPTPPPASFSTSSLTIPNTTPISPFLTTQLERVHSRLGPKRVRSPFLTRDIERLQKELESGMTRARRLEVEVYVAGIRDPWKRACTELYLARYPGFVMRGDGKLDFGTRRRDGEVRKEMLRGKWGVGGIGGCGVM